MRCQPGTPLAARFRVRRDGPSVGGRYYGSLHIPNLTLTRTARLRNYVNARRHRSRTRQTPGAWVHFVHLGRRVDEVHLATPPGGNRGQATRDPSDVIPCSWTTRLPERGTPVTRPPQYTLSIRLTSQVRCRFAETSNDGSRQSRGSLHANPATVTGSPSMSAAERWFIFTGSTGWMSG